MNQKLRTIMDAILILEDVPEAEIERLSLAHKALAMYSEGKEGKEGKSFIDCCDDLELRLAVKLKDPRLGLYVGPHINPDIFNYLRRHRPSALH